MSSEKNAAQAKAQAMNSLILLNVHVRKLEKQTLTAFLLQEVTLLAAQTPQQLEAMILTVVESPSKASKLTVQLKNIVDRLAVEERTIKDEADRLQATNNRLFSVPHNIFRSFPRLPIELRQKIWEHAASGRIIEFYTDLHHKGCGGIKISKASTRFFYNTMAACKEARDYLKSSTRYQNHRGFWLLLCLPLLVQPSQESHYLLEWDKQTSRWPAGSIIRFEGKWSWSWGRWQNQKTLER